MIKIHAVDADDSDDADGGKKRKILWYDVGFFRVTCYKEAFINMFQEPLRNGWLCPGCPRAKLVYLKLRHGSPSEGRTRSDSCFLREPFGLYSVRTRTHKPFLFPSLPSDEPHCKTEYLAGGDFDATNLRCPFFQCLTYIWGTNSRY